MRFYKDDTHSSYVDYDTIGEVEDYIKATAGIEIRFVNKNENTAQNTTNADDFFLNNWGKKPTECRQFQRAINGTCTIADALKKIADRCGVPEASIRGPDVSSNTLVKNL